MLIMNRDMYFDVRHKYHMPSYSYDELITLTHRLRLARIMIERSAFISRRINAT